MSHFLQEVHRVHPVWDVVGLLHVVRFHSTQHFRDVVLRTLHILNSHLDKKKRGGKRWVSFASSTMNNRHQHVCVCSAGMGTITFCNYNYNCNYICFRFLITIQLQLLCLQCKLQLQLLLSITLQLLPTFSTLQHTINVHCRFFFSREHVDGVSIKDILSIL